jgi:hypothetical protein
MNAPNPAANVPLAHGTRLEGWLAAHRTWILAAIVISSLAVRAVYYSELSRGPCIWQHRWQQSDMNFFDAWARAVAGGDWLTRHVPFPPHQWHETVAEQYFREFPDAAAAPRREADRAGVSPTTLLWTRWYGGENFYKEPLYPYLIAITYHVLGDDVRWVFLWQMALGVLSVVLVFLITRRCFGELAGLLAAALAVLCSPVLYYELLLLRETTVIFAGLLLVCLTMLLGGGRGWGWWLLFGAVGGLCILLKSTFVLYVVGALAILLTFRQPWRLRFSRAGLVLAGIAAALSPAVARNVEVGASPLSLSSIGTVTFICSNASDVPQDGFAISEHTGEIMGRSGGRLAPAALMTIRTHPSVAGFWAMLARKWDLTWYWYEVPNNSNFYYFGLHAGILRQLPVTCALLSPLAIVGLVLSWPQRRTAWPLLLMVGMNVAVLMAFAVMSRLRVPLVSLMIPLAGLTVAKLAVWLTNRRVLPAAVALIAIAFLACWTDRPLPAGYAAIRGADYQAPYDFYYDPQSAAAAARGDYAAAAEILSRSLGVRPRVIDVLSERRPTANDYEIQLAVLYADVYTRLGNYLDRAGDIGSAVRMKDRARALEAAARAVPAVW